MTQKTSLSGPSLPQASTSMGIDSAQTNSAGRTRSIARDDKFSLSGLFKRACVTWLAASAPWAARQASAAHPGEWAGTGLSLRPGLVPPNASTLPQKPLRGTHAVFAPISQEQPASSEDRLGFSRRSGRQLTHAKVATAHHDAAPTYELVLSRPRREEIAWIFKIPDFWKVLVYSTLTTEDAQLWPPGLSPQGAYEVIQYPHEAFATAFAHHLSSRFRDVAKYTIFVPAYPLQQSPSLIDMMTHPALLATVQTASYRVADHFPPQSLQTHDMPDPWYRSERFSMFTLEPLSFTDQHVYYAAQTYRRLYDLAPDSNLIKHFFSEIGLEDWISNTTEAGSFAYGGIFGVARPKVRQHPVSIYENFLAKTLLPDPITLFVERTWMILFGGENFRDHKPQIWHHGQQVRQVQKSQTTAQN